VSAYEVIFIVIITPKKTKGNVEFDEEKAIYFLSSTGYFFSGCINDRGSRLVLEARIKRLSFPCVIQNQSTCKIRNCAFFFFFL